MVEAQKYLGNLLIHMDQAGGIVGLVLGFALGLTTALILFYQAHVRA